MFYSYRIKFVDSNKKLGNTKGTDQNGVFPRLTSSLKASFKFAG